MSVILETLKAEKLSNCAKETETILSSNDWKIVQLMKLSWHLVCKQSEILNDYQAYNIKVAKIGK